MFLVFYFQAHLLSCTTHCLVWHQELQNQSRADEDDDEEEEEGGLHEELQAILDSMTRRMIKSELEDFELVCHCSHIQSKQLPRSLDSWA